MKITIFALLFVLIAFAYAGIEGSPVKTKSVGPTDPTAVHQRKAGNRKTSAEIHNKAKKELNHSSSTEKTPGSKNQKNVSPKPGRKQGKKSGKKEHHHHEGNQAGGHKKKNHEKKHTKHRSHPRKENNQKVKN